MRAWVLAALLAATGARAAGEAHDHAAPVDPEAAITVTINPEARVSVERGPPPRPVDCGAATRLPVRVLNEGRVTAPLRASLVSGDVAMAFEAIPLSGLAEERRTLEITVTGPDPADVTLAFSVSRDPGDGGARAHLLIRCKAGLAASAR
jgi:hypothetical protein